MYKVGSSQSAQLAGCQYPTATAEPDFSYCSAVPPFNGDGEYGVYPILYHPDMTLYACCAPPHLFNHNLVNTDAN